MSSSPFTVGIPVFNEEDLIEANTHALLEFLRPLGAPFEVLIGSNGSDDRTVELGEALAREVPEVRFFHVPQRGAGRAFKIFMKEARFDLLVSLDMDLSIDLGFVAEALWMLEKFDVVVGSKKTGSQDRSAFRRLGSNVFVAVATGLLHIDFVDYSIGAKAYRIPAIAKYAPVVSDGTAYVLDLIYYVHRDSGRVAQIPVDCQDHRASKFNLGREAAHKFLNLARLWRNRNLHLG